MTPLETQLRAALADHAPDSVDTTGWAQAARSRAHRTRTRTTAMVTLVVAVIVSLTAVGVLTREPHRATLPAHPRPPDTAHEYAALCAKDVNDSGALLGDVQPSLRYAAIALCPVSPTDPGWAQLPSPALLTGSYLDYIVSGSGPPVENCELGQPQLPNFRMVAQDHQGNITEVPGRGERCGGAQVAQSFAGGLARQAFDAAHPAGVGCAGLTWSDAVQPPRHLPTPTSVHLCVTADPSIEAEPSPLRYRPVRSVELDRAQSGPVLEALDRVTWVSGRYVDCPWRHTTVQVVTSNDAGARLATLFICQQDYTTGVQGAQHLSTMRGVWPVLPDPVQALVQEEVSAYLNGRAG
jgi:hypothetical protein